MTDRKIALDQAAGHATRWLDSLGTSRKDWRAY
jgi:hypothetical protein